MISIIEVLRAGARDNRDFPEFLKRVLKSPSTPSVLGSNKWYMSHIYVLDTIFSGWCEFSESCNSPINGKIESKYYWIQNKLIYVHFFSIYAYQIKDFYEKAFSRIQRHAHSIVNWWHSEKITELGIQSPDTWFSFSLFLVGVWESCSNHSTLRASVLIVKWWWSPKRDNFENAATYSISGFKCLK